MTKKAQNSSIYRADGIKNPLYYPETDILSVLQRVSEKVSLPTISPKKRNRQGQMGRTSAKTHTRTAKRRRGATGVPGTVTL